jgi:hypothetical protein
MKNKQDNREIKCVADNFVLLSNPPKYKCINCGQIWFCHDNTPICNIPMKTKSKY